MTPSLSFRRCLHRRLPSTLSCQSGFMTMIPRQVPIRSSPCFAMGTRRDTAFRIVMYQQRRFKSFWEWWNPSLSSSPASAASDISEMEKSTSAEKGTSEEKATSEEKVTSEEIVTFEVEATSEEESNFPAASDPEPPITPPTTTLPPSAQTEPPTALSSSTVLPSLDGLKEWRSMVELDRREAKDDQIVTPLIQEIYRPDLHLPSAPANWQGYEPSTPLTEAITARIGVSGRPISTAEFMRMALMDPEHGYYTQAKTTKHLFHLRTGASRDDFDDDDWDEPATENSTRAAPAEKTDTIIGADFVTAPEVSHVFGECVGVWFATQWQSETYKNGWQWLECGPGKGTLMVDLLRFTLQLSSEVQKKQPQFRDSGATPPSFFGDGCQYIHFIEQSPAFRQQQREALEKAFRHDFRFDFGDDKSSLIIEDTSFAHKMKRTMRVRWHDTFADFRYWSSNTTSSKVSVVQGDAQRRLPTFIVGQEFLDALPVYTFEKTTEGYWRERLVDVALRDDLLEEEKEMAGKSSPSNDASTTNAEVTLEKRLRLRVVLAPDVTPPLKTLLHTDDQGFISSSGKHMDTSPPGSVVEVCPEAILLAQDVAKVVQEQGGAALFIDYGSIQGSSDSLRGYSRHEQVPFLSLPGQVDITADVDFSAIKHAINHRPANGMKEATAVQAFGPVTQGSFLMAMGIQERIINLMERDDTTEEQAENLYRSLLRLASPEEMGERYKVLAIVPATTTTSPSGETAVNAPAGF